MLYIVQHELLKVKSIDFAGLILKHPLTNECWVRVNSSKGSPLKEIEKAADSALHSVNELKKLINSKIKIKKMKFCPECDVRLKKSNSKSELSCPKCGYSESNAKKNK